MPRIRSLKPEFFKDEDLCEHPPWVRLLYAGLWIQADREGRLEDRPVKLGAEIFPYDRFNVDKGLTMLTSPKKYAPKHDPFIVRYSVNGERYIQIVKFPKHQTPHHTEKDSVIPCPPKDVLSYPRSSPGVIQECSGASQDAHYQESYQDLSSSSLSDIEEIRILWNEFAGKLGLPKIEEIKKGTTRCSHVMARMTEKGFNFKALLEIVADSPFLLGQSTGKKQTPFFVTFDWLMCPSNYQKVKEGNYLNRQYSGLRAWMRSKNVSQ